MARTATPGDHGDIDDAAGAVVARASLLRGRDSLAFSCTTCGVCCRSAVRDRSLAECTSNG